MGDDPEAPAADGAPAVPVEPDQPPPVEDADSSAVEAAGDDGVVVTVDIGATEADPPEVVPAAGQAAAEPVPDNAEAAAATTVPPEAPAETGATTDAAAAPGEGGSAEAGAQEQQVTITDGASNAAQPTAEAAAAGGETTAAAVASGPSTMIAAVEVSDDVELYERLAARLRLLINLEDYKDDLWTSENEAYTIEFLKDSSRRRLIVYIDTSNVPIAGETVPGIAIPVASEEELHKMHKPILVVQSSLPVPSASGSGGVYQHMKGLMYFLKEPSLDEKDLNDENFEKKIQYGTLSVPPAAASAGGANVMDCLLRMMQGLFVPVLSENQHWPESVRKDFRNQMNKFMAFLTDTTFQMKGHTVLYVPNDFSSDFPTIAVPVLPQDNPAAPSTPPVLSQQPIAAVDGTVIKVKDVVQRLESLLVHWTRQIKDVVNNQHTSGETTENSGPLEEIQFWRSRCDDLSSISEQLKRPEVQRIISVLEAAKSSYLEQFLRLSNSIQEGTFQAQDNLRFLSTLSDPCSVLSTAEPKDIPGILPKLLNCIRIIWTNSKNYNTRERLTSLLRKVSNEIIRRCCAKISLDDIFHGDVQASTLSLQDSIGCGEAWKLIYKKMCVHVASHCPTIPRPGATSWDFDQSSIFAQIDAFVQRCRDLLEVCEGQIQFSRKINGEKAPIPFFGGSRGPEVAKSLEDIEMAFEKHILTLWNIRKYILDVKATRWHDDYNNFKQGVKDLEVMMQNVIMSAFESATTVESSVELLEIFHHLAKREAIKRTVEKKTADVYLLFIQEMNTVKVEFETHRKTPEILRSHPDFAGSAYWARALLKRVSHSMNTLQSAYFLPHTSLADEAKIQFEPLVAALEDYITKTHADWAGSVGPSLAERLDGTLMARRGADLLEIKFDRDLLRLFAEIHYWQKLKCDIPFHVQEIYSKREELRVLRENVLLVIRDYNGILETLSPEEHLLFRERIRFLDRKINPGLTSLTWASKGITEYFVKECRRHAHDVQKTVSDFIEANQSIQRACRNIADTLLLTIENKKIYDLDEFEATQETYRKSIGDSLLGAHETILQTLQVTFEVFRNDGKDVYTQWVKYVEKIDAMVEESVRVSVKRSLQEISKSINGEGKNRDGSAEVHPIFKVNVILENQKVDFNPTLQRLEDTVNKVAHEMISTIAVIPRLSEILTPESSKAGSNIYDIIANEDDILKSFAGIQNGMSNNATKSQAYLRNWDSYREIWEINKDAFIRRYAKLKPALSTFDADINRYNEVANNTQKEETLTNINFVRLDCSILKHALVSHCNAWQNKLTTLLNTNASTELNTLHDTFAKRSAKLKTPPTDLDQLSESLSLLAQLQADSASIEAQFEPIHEQYRILEKYEVPIKENERQELETLHSSWAALQQTMVEAEKLLQDSKAKFKADLMSSVDEFGKGIASLREDFVSGGPFSSSFGIEKALRSIGEYRTAVQSAVAQEANLKKGLGVFKMDTPPSREIMLITTDLDNLGLVWQLNQEWVTTWDGWRTRPFLTLDATEMEESIQKFQKRLGKMGRETKEWDVFIALKERINQCRRTLPVLLDLKNPAMRDRHWTTLMEEIGKTFQQDKPDFTLEKIFDLGLDQYAESISALSAAATKELSIEDGLATIKAAWAALDLDIVPYKEDRGYFKLRSTDAIFELLEDNQVALSTMKSSKFFEAFGTQIDFWEKTLTHVIEVFEMLLQVQRQWMYLENIFIGTEDIRKQLPKESTIFDAINATYKQILIRMVGEKNALKATQADQLLETLNDMNAKLEKIQKSLDMYLETKRQAFPRFYFLSNDDLLEILGQARDPNAVQPHLKKCFDNINKLELIVAGPVEAWLLEIENTMRITLRKLLMGCILALKKVKKDKWIKDWPGQLLITAGLISWTVDCTKSLQEIEKGDKHALKTLKKKQISSLKKLADLVRNPLSKVERKKLIALITIEVHSRDVIERMVKANCDSVNAFDWLCQLRFYWEKEGKEEDDCIIRQINTQFKYGYEYLGNSGRLVITPLTDRCYMTLTTALHLQRGGSPQGPAGTGKTETVKDLGKALGKYVIVQNCSDALDYKSIGRMFSGLAQTGAWGCFDEFNRIDIEVLSVVALQISSILQAIARGAKTFIFEGKEIRLNVTCGIFITMNPGYAGRVELPDNLKSLFRPVSMMVPDSALIAEIMLFAEGFSNTRNLSKKVDTLYRLAAQQLSKQDHYDFGLRALTSALRSAGSRKRQDMNSPDEVVLFCSMRDNNIPKLTAEDTPLFAGILSDLFPGIEPTSIDYTEFKAALLEETKTMNLQSIDSMILKIIQLHETKMSRHGVMIVGDTGSGKTSVWKLLQMTLTRLSKSRPDTYVPVKIYPLNPKAVTLGELYGEVNIASNEWTDGILSSVMRQACSDEKKDQKWILLDGPVDTLWIESMNTVLDDNKVLTLINGERIALPEQVSLLFEVENLSTASPATVSRAGMIYMDYKDLGWRPYTESWIQARKDRQSVDIIRRLVEKYIPQTLEFRKASSCEELVPVPEASGSLTEESRRRFDMFLREIEGQFPSKDTVYEYFVDKQNKTWASWEDKLPSGWRYPPNMPFYKIFVPTIDTIRNEFILRALIDKKNPFLVVGDVGTGKTSLIQNVISSFDGSKNFMLINMSAQTSSQGVQAILESKVEKRTKNIFVPIGGKQLVSFIDDFNMPMKDTFGSQPPLELIRHWMDYGFCYDRQKQTVKYINDILIIAAMGPPGGGRNPISPRIQSRFNVINMTFPGETSINRIYSSIINQKLQDFEEDVKPLGEIMTHATLEIYHTVISQLLPTPAKIHYLFNLRDISKVFQGLLRANKEYYDSRESITKLWVHEIYRVFYDRLVDKEDRDYFQKLVDDKLVAHFSSSIKQLYPDKKISIFGDFMSDGGAENAVYEELIDFDKMKKFIEDKLFDYNQEPGFIQVDLVLFRDAIEHICRITRILRQPCGNVLLIGVGGSGRQSLTRLAAYVVDISIFQIKITKHYRYIEFREDLKALYRMTGVDDKPTAFLFTDTQILADSFLEDISNILASGEVPNLFPPEELAEIKQSLTVAGKDRPSESGDPLYEFFIERVRSNLHVVLCMSPVGDAFRNRLRMFPSLVNCTTIDWFSEWPEDALTEVALKYLDNVDLGADGVKKAVAQVMVSVHTSVVETSRKMILELKRYNYVTPINYLELVTGYRELLGEKRKSIGEAAVKLKNGLSKLDDTRENVEKISVELEVAKKQVAQYQKQCEDYLVIIVQQKREADEQAKGVAAKTEKLTVEEEEVRGVADAAQADLDLAMPALNAAVKALEGINKKDLQEIRSYGKPPPLVEKVMEAVMVLKKCEPTWDEAKRQLGNPYFIKQLINFDKDNISDKILKKISQYCADENFNPEVVGRVSGAAKSLCMWAKAMETYGIIYRQVAPKKEKLRSAQETLEKKQKSLREAKAKLQEIQEKLIELKDQYDEKVSLKEKLRQDSEQTEMKLMRAEQLVSGLSGERDRWEKSIKFYEESIRYLPGDCLLAAAFLSYAGPFNSTYRDGLVEGVWLAQIKTLEIPFTPGFAFETFIGKPTDIRDWNIQGLPSDAFSAENGIIVTRGRRWPLMVDPQGQANTWIKNMESKRGLKIIDLKQSDYLRTLENAIQYGLPVMLQGLTEAIDPALDPVLNKSVVKKGGIFIIKIGEKEIEYNPEFRFYLTTKLANPHYAPEVFAKATIVNFAVKEKGLEDQLLGIVVRREKRELEEQKNTLVSNVAIARRRLVELEDEILQLLSTAQGSLLDDEKLVNTLQSSKSIAEDVTQQLVISEQTEKRIDAAREGYRPCAQRASILYFVLNDLASVDPMYQFSLDSYVDLFEKSISNSKRFEDLNERLVSLNDYHTYAVYKNTCRGLFEQHKLLFSLQMTAKIMEASGKLNNAEYDFFLRGGQVLDKDTQLPNPCSDWIVEVAWDNLTELDNLPAFSGIVSSIEQSEREWKAWFMSNEPEELALPGDWENKLNDLQKMLIVRSLRSDRVIFCAQMFVVTNLGQKFVEPPILDISDILSDSSPRIPLIFVLSPGVDPTSGLAQLAEKRGMLDRFNYLSLGQGQAPKATRLIQEGLKEGNWVFLANCHLSISWMPALDKIIENIPQENPHPDFRLWLSSSPTPQFPISILQTGIKMTTEPPKGIRANMTRLYNTLNEDTYEKSKHPDVYQKLLYSLCFFHSLLIERKKFLTLGWNVVCDFNNSDFEVCENLLVVLLDEYEQTPWDALKYLIAEANYGGRVTDDWDRRILRSYINHLFNEEALSTPQYRISSLPNYYIPETVELQVVRDYISTLPVYDKPEIFGQHPNADIASQIKESGTILQCLLSLQPQISFGAGQGSREDKVLAIAADLLRKLPEDLDVDLAKKIIAGDLSPLNVVLIQEIQRYNVLLQCIRKSLSDLQNGVKGIVVMTPDLEETFNAIFEGKVPPAWSRAAYPSLKMLASWTRELVMRVEHFSEWSKGVEPKLFWLGAFTFPTGFLTAVLQKTARKSNIPVDILSWEFTVLQLEDDNHIQQAPKDGVYVKNIYLEGAGWDRKNNCLKDSKAMELITAMPPIHFRPVESKKKASKGMYTCPLYYYPVRSGTRERPSLIIAMELKTGVYDQEFYIKKGTAALASLA
ncbi:Dynein heavy chain 2, axonemal [Irineochytrium annulatum]|nr:Dynein heavy chain 2, axonemal [Irineochytrium annulatum]